MTTRRERLERKLAKRAEWAESRRQKAEALREQNTPYADDWAFMSQPGRIPERERANRRSEKAWEHDKMSRHHEAKADGLERQLDKTIFDDDPDACDRLRDRIAENEAERDRMKYINREIRKGDGWSERIDPPLTEGERAELARSAKFTGKAGYPSYALTNLGARIRADKKRLERLENG